LSYLSNSMIILSLWFLWNPRRNSFMTERQKCTFWTGCVCCCLNSCSNSSSEIKKWMLVVYWWWDQKMGPEKTKTVMSLKSISWKILITAKQPRSLDFFAIPEQIPGFQRIQICTFWTCCVCCLRFMQLFMVYGKKSNAGCLLFVGLENADIEKSEKLKRWCHWRVKFEQFKLLHDN